MALRKLPLLTDGAAFGPWRVTPARREAADFHCHAGRRPEVAPAALADGALRLEVEQLSQLICVDGFDSYDASAYVARGRSARPCQVGSAASVPPASRSGSCNGRPISATVAKVNRHRRAWRWSEGKPNETQSR